MDSCLLNLLSPRFLPSKRSYIQSKSELPRFKPASISASYREKQDTSCNLLFSRRSRRCFSFGDAFSKREVKVRSGNWWSGHGGNTGNGGRHEFGNYPWEDDGEDEGPRMEWVQEDIITLFTDQGVVQLGGSRVPKLVQSGKKVNPVKRFREEDFMDPHQKLCLGALFDIAATNIVVLEKQSLEGLHEKLHLTVAIPLLWGVPPAVDALSQAVRSGGGIVDKVYRQWEFF